MKTSPFNEEQKQFIRDNYEELPAQQIADKLGVTKYHIYNFTVSDGLRKLNPYAPKPKVDSEFFDVNKRDWFI